MSHEVPELNYDSGWAGRNGPKDGGNDDVAADCECECDWGPFGNFAEIDRGGAEKAMVSSNFDFTTDPKVIDDIPHHRRQEKEDQKRFDDDGGPHVSKVGGV